MGDIADFLEIIDREADPDYDPNWFIKASKKPNNITARIARSATVGFRG